MQLPGKRSADNARRFMIDVAGRLDVPEAARQRRARLPGGQANRTIVQISTDGFAAYPEAVDLAFGPYVQVTARSSRTTATPT